jgi:hypothetical protein
MSVEKGVRSIDLILEIKLALKQKSLSKRFRIVRLFECLKKG